MPYSPLVVEIAAETGLPEAYIDDVLSLRATQPYSQRLIDAMKRRGHQRFDDGSAWRTA